MVKKNIKSFVVRASTVWKNGKEKFVCKNTGTSGKMVKKNIKSFVVRASTLWKNGKEKYNFY